MAATMLLYQTPISHPRSRRNTAIFRSADAASLPWLNQDQLQDVPPVPPPKSIKSSPSLPALRAIPYTTTEWKKLLLEIKREYLAKHYRACASRCAEILDNIKHSDTVQPAYLIFLRFYAASSLEMQVRGHQASSPHRIQLLQQARQHYTQASELAKSADERLAQIKSLRPDSPSSSLHSPVGSDMSHETASTRMSSPTPSLDSLHGHSKVTGPPVRPKKRVAFCDTPEYEPFIRPDSPTLGMDDPASGRSSPCLAPPPAPMVEHIPEPVVPIEAQDSHKDDEESTSQALYRYGIVLSGIQSQITSHLASIDNDIAAAENPAANSTPVDKHLRALELPSRIERLRANGWQRKRFDPQRYETFREQVMADMMA